MGKELHVGAGLLILAATCGRVALKNGDVLVRNGDVVVGAARHLDDASDLRHLGGLEGARHLDGLGSGVARHADELRHAEHPLHELLGDVAMEGAQLTAEHLAEWENDLGELDSDDFSGVWQQTGQLEHDVAYERTCVRSEEGDTYAFRCEETGSQQGRQAYRARWNGQQAIGSDTVCSVVEKVHQARIDVQGEAATAIADHLRPQLKNDRPCAPRATLGQRR